MSSRWTVCPMVNDWFRNFSFMRSRFAKSDFVIYWGAFSATASIRSWKIFIVWNDDNSYQGNRRIISEFELQKTDVQLEAPPPFIYKRYYSKQESLCDVRINHRQYCSSLKLANLHRNLKRNRTEKESAAYISKNSERIYNFSTKNLNFKSHRHQNFCVRRENCRRI